MFVDVSENQSGEVSIASGVQLAMKSVVLKRALN